MTSKKRRTGDCQPQGKRFGTLWSLLTANPVTVGPQARTRGDLTLANALALYRTAEWMVNAGKAMEATA